MVLLRATQKVLRSLPAPSKAAARSDTALGDWYVHRIVVDRQPLLLLVSSSSLLALLTPARSVRTLPDRLADLVAARLHRLGAPPEAIEREVAAMERTVVQPTASRSVVGTMVELGRLVPVYLPEGRWGEPELTYAESRLADTPCRLPGAGSRYIFPGELARQLLEELSLPGP